MPLSSPTPASSSPGLGPVTRALVLTVAAIGFLFDTYELLMFPVIGAQAVGELVVVDPTESRPEDTSWWVQLGFTRDAHHRQGIAQDSTVVRLWAGRMLWIAALCGGVFGLMGGVMIDRFGRKRVMVAAILAYSFSPVAAALSTELWQLVLFRSTTFIGVCVELVAAVTWLAELFADKRQRELAIGWTLACASIGGLFVTEVYTQIQEFIHEHPEGLLALPSQVAWRYTLLTGLIPGALILVLMPFVPESWAWREKKRAGTLKRPRLRELFAPELRRTTIATTILSACGYAAAFGALQLTPPLMTPGLPKVQEEVKAAVAHVATAKTPEEGKAAADELVAAKGRVPQKINATRGNIQRWQELGGLLGRVLFAVLVVYVASRMLIRLFLIPGLVLFPLTYLVLYQGDYTMFATAVFFCGLVTVAQFSYVSEYLPKVFPLHLRGTGSAFATNIGGRMIGTMAAIVNTELLAPLFSGGNPIKVATAAAVIGASVYAIALVVSFLLPEPAGEAEKPLA